MPRRLTIFILLALSAIAAVHASYTVQQIPNVHLSSRTRYVSNPDGILSDAAVTRLDSMISRIWQATSAEVVVVAVDDIDPDADTQQFATELFTAWGIGKKDKDNGLLLLIAKDRREAVIRTGYGIEGVVPDILAGQIIRHEMAPDFRDGNYDGGTLKAVERLSQVITDPEVRDELMSSYANDANAGAGESIDLFKGYITLSAIATAALLAIFLYLLLTGSGMDKVQRYRRLDKLTIPSLFMTFLFLGGPLLVFIPLRFILRRLRRSKRQCPNCGHVMNLMDEERDNFYLTPAQDTEEKINSVDYDVWLCPQCGETDIIPYINKAFNFVECPNCHARTAELIGDRITTQPTTAHAGIGTRIYYCRNCHQNTYKQYNIPKLPTPVIITGGGGGGFGGGGFSGGSFGGGMTGGGGARGGW